MRLTRRELLGSMAISPFAPTWVSQGKDSAGRLPRPEEDQGTARAVLLEFFVSQGCDLCPQAEILLGQLVREFRDQVVAVTYHVDYFNKPWKDPWSNPIFSQREMQYSLLYTRANNIDNKSYLYLTPLLMIDGRVPLVASNEDSPAKARAAIRSALTRSADVALMGTFGAPAPPTRQNQEGRAKRQPAGSAGNRRSISVLVQPLSPRYEGQEVLIQAVTFVDGLSTEVESGELAGKSYLGRNVARDFEFQAVTLEGRRSRRVDFNAALPADADPKRAGVAIIAQDESSGAILQSRRLSWPAAESDDRTEGEAAR